MVIREEADLLQSYKESVEAQHPGFNVEESVNELQKIINSLDDPNVNLSQMFNKVVENSLWVSGFNDFAKKQMREEYKPSPFLTELLEAQEDRRLADTKK